MQTDKQSGNGILEEFRIGFWDCWQRLPNKAFFFTLLAAWLLLFQYAGNSTLGYVRTRSLFHWMYTAYNPPLTEAQIAAHETAETDDGHGNLVPFVVLALLWWKRKELMAADLRIWSPGLALVLGGVICHVLGYAVQQPRISVVGLFTGIYGLMGLAWGPGFLKRSFFPYFLFVFAVPLGSLAEPITFRLRLLVSQLVEVVAHYVLAIDVVRSGTKLMDPTGHYEYEVAAACSGIRSLIATIGLGVILGFVSFKQWWKRLVMIGAAFPLAVLGNLLRMLTIVIAAEIGGQEWGKAVHEGGPGGLVSLLPYLPAFIGLLMLESFLLGPKPAREPTAAAAPKSVIVFDAAHRGVSSAETAGAKQE